MSPVTTTRYRVLFLLLGVALIAVVVGAVVLAPSGRDPGLPDVVRGYSPTDGATVLRQTEIVVDLEGGYIIELTIDGVPIPAAEIDGNMSSGSFSWRPGPDRTFAEWSPGFHQVLVTWDRSTGLPDPGSLRWVFRVQ